MTKMQLFTACANGDMLSLLTARQKNAFPKFETKPGDSPIQTAAANGQLEVVQFLLQNQLFSRDRAQEIRSAICSAAYFRHYTLLRWLATESEDLENFSRLLDSSEWLHGLGRGDINAIVAEVASLKEAGFLVDEIRQMMRGPAAQKTPRRI